MSPEIYADHCPDLEIDEEQQDVVEPGISLLHGLDIEMRSRPHDGTTDDEQSDQMEGLDQVAAQSLNFRDHGLSSPSLVRVGKLGEMKRRH